MTDGYQVKGPAFTLATPYQGDTMMARSGNIIGSRVAGEQGALGYSIEKLNSDGLERQLPLLAQRHRQALHAGEQGEHLVRRALPRDPPLHTSRRTTTGHGRSRVRAEGLVGRHLADFVTGKKATITKMGPGQFTLYPHFRSDGWLYFLVVDHNNGKYYVVASDWAVRQTEATPTP